MATKRFDDSVIETAGRQIMRAPSASGGRFDDSVVDTGTPAPLRVSTTAPVRSPFAASTAVPDMQRPTPQVQVLAPGPRVNAATPTPMPRTTQAVGPEQPAISDEERVTMAQEEAFARDQGLARPATSLPVPRVPTVGRAYDMEMVSPAALRLASDMNAGARIQGIRAASGGAREIRLMSPVALENLRARWDEAERRARLGAMSPEQRARFVAAENQSAIENLNIYRQTPKAVEAEADRQRDISVARAQAEGEAKRTMGPAELAARTAEERSKRETELGREELTVEQQKAKTAAEERRATAEESRQSRELTALGDNITKLYASLAGIEDPDSPAAATINKRIAQLEAKQDKLLGITSVAAPTGDAATESQIVSVRGPSGQVAQMTAQNARKYLSRAGYTIVQ